MNQLPRFKRSETIDWNGTSLQIMRDPTWDDTKQSFIYLCAALGCGGMRHLKYQVVLESEIVKHNQFVAEKEKSNI